MPNCNKLLALAVFAALFSVPALADGVPGKPVNRGPPPLVERIETPPRAGCILIEPGRWSCPVIETRIAPPPVRTVTRTVVADQGLTLDLASFSGGVGNGVDGGYYGGGSAVFISGARSYSGVLQASASAFTFRQRSDGGGRSCGCPGGPR